MIQEMRLREELSYATTDLDRVFKVLDIIKMTTVSNPYWDIALKDLANARSRINNITTAMITVEPTALDLPAAAPPPAPL